MINRMLKYVFAIALLATMSCSSVESDAKKAASLINKSIEQTHNLQLEKAEKTYLKAQEIKNKYVEKDKEAEFYELFAEYRDKEKKQYAK
jgi:hypothetical protein